MEVAKVQAIYCFHRSTRLAGRCFCLRNLSRPNAPMPNGCFQAFSGFLLQHFVLPRLQHKGFQEGVGVSGGLLIHIIDFAVMTWNSLCLFAVDSGDGARFSS